MKWLNPIVHILFTFSATLGQGVGLSFSPGKVIFAGIGVLLAVGFIPCSTTPVSATPDTSRQPRTLSKATRPSPTYLSASRTSFNVSTYTLDSTHATFHGATWKDNGPSTIILAVSTKAMIQRRIKKYLKKLVGGTEVEDALQRLDTLTQEEARMGVARNLEVTHDIDRKRGRWECEGHEEGCEDVNKNTSVVKEVTYIVDENVKVSEQQQSN
ncbi:hypothetical protein B0F90DRAFT_1920727 [Multifurca ochricompacta]|uniref:Uncharacterized protein n=1 Tax=Multifurca ochricompacta TaxID=376703 RepID=A0AAD4LVL6_9AGAM|nr:hypothetical protein B0F90DRAFT_1920727 [Multifurca ochricompacta]